MTSDLLERLARANPAPHSEAEPDVELLQRILATPVEAPVRRPRRRLLLVGAAATAVAVALVTSMLPGERLGPSPAAARALERLAVAAAAQPAAPAQGWAYTLARSLYGATNIDGNAPYTVLLPSLRESWVAPNGAARIVETPGRPIFLSESDRRRWREGGGRMEARPPREQRFRSLPLSHALYADVAGLPTQPDALEAELRRQVETQNPPPEDGYSVEGELLNRISTLLHSPASSGELRAALYRVLARLPGVELVGETVDPAGRRGIGFKSGGGYGEEHDPTSRLLIVDPASGDVLAEQTIIERRVEWIDAAPGEVFGEIVYLEHGWVDSPELRP